MTTLGERIAQARREKAVRDRRDVTMREMARAVGVTGTSVSEWESDKVIPREEALAKLAAFLGVTPAYHRYGVQEPAPAIPTTAFEEMARSTAKAAKTAKKKRA